MLGIALSSTLRLSSSLSLRAEGRPEGRFSKGDKLTGQSLSLRAPDAALEVLGLVHDIHRRAVADAIPFLPGIGQALGKNRMIVNPGAVGQPRDGDPRASYAIYDSDSGVVRLYRVEYDISTTQLEMTRKNLPVRLIVRLEHGL